MSLYSCTKFVAWDKQKRCFFRNVLFFSVMACVSPVLLKNSKAEEIVGGSVLDEHVQVDLR